MPMSWIAVRSRLKGRPRRSVLTQTCYAIFRRETSRRFRHPIDIQQEPHPMAVQVPTPDQLRAVADEMGLSLTGADIESFISLMRPSVAAYNVVDAIPDNLPAVKYPRTPGYRPQGEENRHNAWYVKTVVEGASSGKLKGKTVVLKDNIMLAGVPMMNGASTLEGYVPDIDATDWWNAFSMPAAPSPARRIAKPFVCPAAATPTPPGQCIIRAAWVIPLAVRPPAAGCWLRREKLTWPWVAIRAARSVCPPRSAVSTA